MPNYQITDECAMVELGKTLAEQITNGSVVYLQGDLGTGKTTLVRGLLSGYGYRGVVTSPTFSLVVAYNPNGRNIYHLDLFRLNDPQELEWIGIRDMADGESIMLIEWPSRGAGVLPGCDCEIEINYLESGRMVRLTNNSSIAIS